MTTIAYRRGVLATDKQSSSDGTIGRAACKVQRVGDSVFAISGTLVRGLKFIRWLQSDREDDAPKLKNTEVVEMNMLTGKCRLWESDLATPVEDSFFAWGSGRDVALGAMQMGASPKEAIKCADRWDEGTGRGVQVFRSKQGE